MSDINEDVMNLVIRGRHLNISVILVVHNIFFNSKYMRTINLNAHYICLFKNPADRLQIEILGRRMYPGKAALFLEAFLAAAAKNYGYLFWDGKPTTPEKLCLRGSVLKEQPDTFNRVYVIDKSMEKFVLVPLDVIEKINSELREIERCRSLPKASPDLGELSKTSPDPKLKKKKSS